MECAARSMKVAAAVVSCMLMLLAGQACAQATVTYRVTLRDFIPGYCATRSEHNRNWGLNVASGSYSGVQDNWFADFPLDIDDAPFFSKQSGTQSGNGFTIDNSIYCPYWTDMVAGRVAGHPDYESSSNPYFVDGPSCAVGCEGTSATATITPTVQPTLMPHHSGLGKVEYCNSTTGRCGRSLNPSVNKHTFGIREFFDLWFDDDLKYNKRVGRKLVLEEDGDTFQFDSNSGGAGNPKFIPLVTPPLLGELYVEPVTEAAYPDPDEAPLWPNSMSTLGGPTPLSLNPLSSLYRERFGKMWFSTEIHVHFQFSPLQTFSFSGDDDVWVYIDNTLVVDLGGLHPPRDGFVDLAVVGPQLGLVDGQIYNFDLFHAERHTFGSNFKLTTKLSSACNVLDPAVASTQFALDGGAGTSVTAADLALSRNAAFDEGTQTISLTSAASLPFVTSYAYLEQQQNVGAGFIASFTVQLSKTGKNEGFAFVLHDRPDGLEDLPQSAGSSLGFRYLTNSVAVVFDLCRDRNDTYACKTQRVSLHYPGSASDFNGPDDDTLTVWDDVLRTLKRDDETHEIRIEYLETPDWIEVYIDDSLYLRKEDFSVEAVLGGRDAFVGLTAATSDEPSPIDIVQFTIETVTVDPTVTLPVDLFEAAEPLRMVADGESLLPTFSILTRDFCTNDLTYGGFEDDMIVLFVETIPANATSEFLYFNDSTTPAVVEGEMLDNNDGTYTAGLITDVPGTFALYVVFDPTVLTLDVPLVPSALNATLMEAAVVSPVGAAFFAKVNQAVIAAPLTASPTGAPVTFAPTDAADNSEAVVIASAAGGGSGALFVLAAIVLLIMRRKWQRDKAFINEGMLYNMEQDVTYDKNDEFAVVGRMVMTTQQEILRERAQKTATPQDQAINDLELQKAELQEQLRVQKQQKQSTGAGAAAIFAKGKPKATRKQFAAAQDAPDL